MFTFVGVLILHDYTFTVNLSNLLRLQLRRLLPLADDVEESSVDVLSQVAGLQRTALLLERQSRALPCDAATTVGGQSQRLALLQAVVVLPDPVVVRLTVSQQCRQATCEGVTLATGALQATLALGDKCVVAVRDVVLGALLDDRDTTKSLGQLGAQLGWVTLVDINALSLRQTSKLDDVGCENALLAPLNKLRARLSKEQTVSVQHKRNALLLRLLDHLRACVLHQLVATESGANDDDVQARQHVDDFGGDRLGALGLRDILLLPHNRVHHQIGGVRLDDGGGAGLADDVGLRRALAALFLEEREQVSTMSQPSFAEAMAEKYGAPV